jgi:hypothetical protein
MPVCMRNQCPYACAINACMHAQSMPVCMRNQCPYACAINACMHAQSMPVCMRNQCLYACAINACILCVYFFKLALHVSANKCKVRTCCTISVQSFSHIFPTKTFVCMCVHILASVSRTHTHTHTYTRIWHTCTRNEVTMCPIRMSVYLKGLRLTRNRACVKSNNLTHAKLFLLHVTAGKVMLTHKQSHF